MRMYINGQWIDKAETIPVFNPFDQSVLDTVPRGTPSDVDLAITSAVRGAKAMAKLTAYERYAILHRAAEPDGGTAGGLGADHNQRRRQGHRRRPRRSATGHPDHYHLPRRKRSGCMARRSRWMPHPETLTSSASPYGCRWAWWLPSALSTFP